MSSFPVDAALPRLRAALAGGGVAVLTAPPGAGKTTRVPPALLEALPAHGRIVMLEPRRLAAVSAARWMARALGEEVGRTVGYAIRFERRVSAATRIEVVTEGILTRRLQTDPGLDGVALVIFDEFHERSLNADLALALCLDARRNLREDLALLVMSATLDAGPVAALLGGAPVVAAPGKTFAVDVRYLDGDRDARPSRVPALVARAVERALAETEGDVLAFLPGAGEIRACAELLRGSAAVAAGGDRPAPALRRPAVRGAGAGAAARGAAQGRARHVDRRDEPHHRGRAHGGRFRARPPGRAPRRLGDGPPRHGAGSPVAGRPARRPCRADRPRRLLPALLAAGLRGADGVRAARGARRGPRLAGSRAGDLGRAGAGRAPVARPAARRPSGGGARFARRPRRARCRVGADRRRQGHGAPAAAPAPGAPRAPRGVGRRRGVRVQPGGAALRPRRARPGGAPAGAGRRGVRPRGPHRGPGAFSRDRQGRRRHGRGGPARGGADGAAAREPAPRGSAVRRGAAGRRSARQVAPRRLPRPSRARAGTPPASATCWRTAEARGFRLRAACAGTSSSWRSRSMPERAARGSFTSHPRSRRRPCARNWPDTS